MAVKKRKKTSVKKPRKVQKKRAKAKAVKKGTLKRGSVSKKTPASNVKKNAPSKKVHHRIEVLLKDEIENQAEDMFVPAGKWTFKTWLRRYSPVLVTMLIGLATYFYLIFYLFYPNALLYGNYFQLLLLLMFIFLVAGLFVYLGFRAELLFVRILSFIFVFVLFTFLLLFVLIAHSMQGVLVG